MRPIHGQEQGHMHMRRRDLAPPDGIWARQSWVEALRDDSVVKLSWVPTQENLADLNSKFLPVARFEELRNRILHPKRLPTLEAAATA